MELDNTTNLSCIKILIRLARTNSEIAERIMSHTSLMECLMGQFERIGSVGDRKTIHSFILLKKVQKIFNFQIFIYLI